MMLYVGYEKDFFDLNPELFVKTCFLCCPEWVDKVRKTMLERYEMFVVVLNTNGTNDVNIAGTK